MRKMKLTKEEKETLKAFEADEFKSVLTPKRKASLIKAAEEACKQDKRINIKLSSQDLDTLQRHALKEGIPYQAFAASILHKYISGGLSLQIE